MSEEEKIDPETGEKIEPEDKTGDEPEDKTGKPKEKDYSELSSEELDKIIAEEREQEIEQMILDRLEEAGLGEFKDLNQVAKSLKFFRDEDNKVFSIMKSLAKELGTTPEELAKGVDEHFRTKVLKGKPGVGEPAPKLDDERFEKLEGMTRQATLDLKFTQFQRRMEKDEIEIPDSRQKPLQKLLPMVLGSMTEAELKKVKSGEIDPWEEANELYEYRLSKTSDPDELKEKLSADEARRERKRRQLKTPAGTPSKRKTQTEVQEEKDWGVGIKHLPEPSKK